MAFSRLLAKIAHCYAVAEYGLNNFEPLLPDLILGKPSPLGHLVGDGFLEEPPEDFLHQIKLITMRVFEAYFLVAEIRLFANLGAPRYRVAVGRFDASSPLLAKQQTLSQL